MEEIPKPRELLAARTSAEALFTLLRDWFEVPLHVTLDLRGVDTAVAELGDPQLIMAMAMRKLQALHLLTTPGVRTTTDVVVTVIQDLERALKQAPAMHLKDEAADTDWDAELAALEDQPVNGSPEAEAFDEIEQFKRHHSALRVAARAVLHASDGQICALI
ncbi:MAG: hypothetical protein GEU81_01325 [Nitriliruptorales bacterium]|nr:hypothetical protein [Nitriliruptorales bacterium]